MWVFDQTLWYIALRSAIVYIVVLIGIRLTGKREVGQMTPFDLILLLLISNAVQNAMTGSDVSVTGGIVAAGTLLVMNALIAQLEWRFPKLRTFVEGSPTILISDGKILEKNLRQEKISKEILLQALREHGITDVSGVQLGVLEVDGSISVLRKDEKPLISLPHHRVRFLRRTS
jgi:uncharacterized membrane protein YcaP (DUF421 family)